MTRSAQSIMTFFALMVFVATVALMLLATNAFISLQYTMLPIREDQKNLAQESLAVLTSFQSDASSINQFESIKRADTQLPFYTAAEISHLIDVKERFDILRLAAIVSFVSLLLKAYAIKKVEFAKQIHASSVSGLFAVGLLGIILPFSWNWFFVTFHLTLFPNGNWSFSPQSSLIQIFPEIFWFRFGVSWVGMILLLLLAITLMSRIIVKRASID